MEAPMCARRSTHAVLVVEDEAILRLDIVDMFEAAGFKTFEAGSAAEAIDILQREADIRVVFTDIDMPGGMDGVQLAHVIRRRWPPTILIIGSGRNFPTLDELPPKTTFLPKPYSEGGLTEVINSIHAQIGDAR
jgi:CheY-like chemotaxis protein